MGIRFLSNPTVALVLRSCRLAVLDVSGFPLRLNWYIVHRRQKRRAPVAQAFNDLLLDEGAP